MSDEVKKPSELEASHAQAKGVRRQYASATHGRDIEFCNDALENSNEVMNTLAPPDAPPPTPKKPKG
jgi:hypothetical protein